MLTVVKKIRRLVVCWFRTLIEPIVVEIVDHAVEIRFQVERFETAPETDRASYWERKFNAFDLVRRFQKSGMVVEELQINGEDFEKWMKEFPSLVECYRNLGDSMIEKILEHYLSFTFLGISRSDIIIDVAAAGSRFVSELRSKCIKAYQQDLVYATDMKGYLIGGNAANMPLPDGFASVLTLHCAFECLQGDSDMGFAREADRILKKGGRLGIVPLYIDAIHFVKTSPWCDKRHIRVEKEAKWLWRDDAYHAPFSRHYSPETFVDRIVSRMPGIDTRILFFKNISEIARSFEGQRIYCHFMFKGEKR
ncbi:MAG: class I SAM-dependent methyltransferase [Candidatus Brocadiaceae bacterium]|nr:class I SAM-dependent methyltransferase [Candidatus Brocadiaceae bacterium]